MSEDNIQLKLLTIGDSGVGKTWLLLRWAGYEGQLSKHTSSMPTIGIDFKMKTVLVNKKRVKIQVWDTAGQERFRTITTSYYRHSHGILLVYDITDKDTFDNIRSWMAQIKTHAEPNTNAFMIGNKKDLEDQRVISYDEGAMLAKEYNIPFMETSAIDGTNVNEAFMMLITNVYERLEKASLLTRSQSNSNKFINRNNSNKLDDQKNDLQNSKCC